MYPDKLDYNENTANIETLQSSAELSCSATDDARDFLVNFMNAEFKDKTFEKYIRNELAGDFACELRKAITDCVWI